MKRRISAIMLILLVISMLTLAFNIQSTKEEPEAVRIDNLIITTSDLEVEASRLTQWKNSCGIPSVVLDVAWIYSHYSGVDEPEKIRNCIKDFHSNFLTKYVTIFGDVDKVPIRYAYVPFEGENLVATDLYYADLDYTWDDNGDGLYADLQNDEIDGIPDVYVGRIPVSLTDVAQGVVTKIIEYQQQLDVSADWINRVVLAAGWAEDGCAGWNVPNCENVSKILVGKDIVRLYESAGNLTNSNIDYEIGRGCSFLHFAGHSVAPDPLLGIPKEYPWLLYKDFWGTHWLGWREVYDWTNGPKFPVVVSSACSSARIDVEECIGEYFICNPNGGAIAYFGPTGISPWNPNAVTGELMLQIYEAFTEGYTGLGEMWSVAISNYIQNNGLDTIYDERTIVEFILLGDPTLRIYNGPETIDVPNDYVSIQGAINSAYDGDTIFVRNGTYCENVVINKTLTLVGENPQTAIIDGGGAGTVLSIMADGVNVSGFTIQNGGDWPNNGIRLSEGTSYCNISGNTIINNYCGISLWSSLSNIISRNTLINNDYGIVLWSSSEKNVIEGNTLTANNNYGIGLVSSSNNIIIENNLTKNNGAAIYLFDSSNNAISVNKFTNNDYGVILWDSSNNTVSGNNFTENWWYGIYLDSSNYNTINGNNIVTNNHAGIYLQSSSNNKIHHNNFIDNAKQVNTYSSVNFWDSGYPSAGNYWSDYAGVDNYSGPYQNEAGSDGIGDAPYVIDVNNVDRYPLMSPWPSRDVAIIDVVPSHCIVMQGGSLAIIVTVINQGDFAETFNLTVYANTTVIGTETVIDLPIRSPEAFSFMWNTTEFARGNYTISAYATLVQGEIDTTDNNYTDGTVTIGIHDIAIISITFSKQNPSVNETIDIFVLLQNNGDFDETFDISANYTLLFDPLIGTQTITLERGESIMLNFTWTPTASGRYEIKAYTSEIPDDINPSDNTKITYLYVSATYTAAFSTEENDWTDMDIRGGRFRYMAYSV
jgi:parallel beta-helix repeat protein